jgi:hypothetical protein
MAVAIVQNRIDRLSRWGNPGVDMFQALYPIGHGTPRIGVGERLASSRAKGAKEVALAAPAIIDRLAGACNRTRLLRCRRGLSQLLAGKALGRFRAHLGQANHETPLRGARVECFNAPLLWANCGSTRSPNQVSWVRQRRPSAIRRSSIRLRLIAMAVCSFK